MKLGTQPASLSLGSSLEAGVGAIVLELCFGRRYRSLGIQKCTSINQAPSVDKFVG